MKLFLTLMTSLFCVLMAGCYQSVQKSPERAINTELVNSLYDIAMENAVISQHTLFPYHFIENASGLNELGQRDLTILARHFMENPGCLNVRRNDVPADLYEARVNLVSDKLKQAGVKTDRINISDGMPGGSGMASERVVIILDYELAQKGDITRTKTTTRSLTFEPAPRTGTSTNIPEYDQQKSIGRQKQ